MGFKVAHTKPRRQAVRFRTREELYNFFNNLTDTYI